MYVQCMQCVGSMHTMLNRFTRKLFKSVVHIVVYFVCVLYGSYCGYGVLLCVLGPLVAISQTKQFAIITTDGFFSN